MKLIANLSLILFGLVLFLCAAPSQAQQKKCPTGSVQVGTTHDTKPDGTPVTHLLCQPQDETEPQLPQGCNQVSRLQDQFAELNRAIDVDRQVEHSFGFDKTSDEIEYFGHLPDRQIEDIKAKAKQLVFNESMSAASAAIADTVKAANSLTPDQVEAVNEMAQVEGLPPINVSKGAQEAQEALNIIQKGRKAYGLVDIARKQDYLKAANKVAGIFNKNPNFGLLLDLDEWALYELYQSIDAVKQVHDLTLATEGDLLNLKVVSARLRQEVDELSSVKKQLAVLGPQCSSTNLVR